LLVFWNFWVWQSNIVFVFEKPKKAGQNYFFAIIAFFSVNWSLLTINICKINGSQKNIAF